VPIGRPIANTCLHVVDPWGQPASVGVAGELCIGGAGLARGYVGQPAGTAERFVPDAWSGTTGARVYRTGDRARWRADGQLEFLGRWDHQVKVRGYRIELGEVEAALGQCDGVREAIAVARPSPIDGDGDGEGEGHVRLLAYVVTDGRPVAAVREALATRLPAYMIPSAIVPLERLPLTANGKIDRAALPSPDDDPRHGEPSLSSTGLTPREELIAAIWADVLGVTSVHRDDDFFVLGGHSLLATRVVSRVRRLLHVDVSLRALLTMRTLAEFAGEVERAQRGAEGLTNAPIVPMPRQPLNPLSFQQQRLWFVDRLDPHRASYNIVAARRLDGVLDIAALRHAVDEVVRRHEILRTHFRAEDGEPFQVVEPHHGAVVPVIDLRGIEGATAREAEARRIADEHARRPFDLTRTPLLRFTLLRLADTSHVVLVTLHHIIGDGWSMQLLIYEIAVLYGAFTQGARSPLPELPLQYADYAIWQRQWLQGGVLERQLAYWTQRLHGAPPYLDILDAAAGRTVVDGGRQIQFEISADTADRVRALGRAQGTTVFMTLLAAFQALLSRYTGREDIVVGTDVAGRTRGETEDLIGLFVNQLVMRTDLSGNPRFIEAIGRVRDVALGAYVHQDLPFERLVEALQPERRAGRNPLFQVMFILQNIPPRDLTNVTRELAIGPFGADSDTTAFDMTLSIADRGTGAMPGSVRFNTRLFAPTTMERLTRDLNAMVAAGVEQPETRIGDIPLETPEEQRDEAAARRERREEKFRKLAAVKPRKLQLSSEQAVTMTPIAAGSALPLMVQPGVDGVDVAAWAASHRELIESRLLEHGGLLFRGFGVASVADFERFTKAMCPGLVEYGERSSPRSRVASGVYTSTDHPKTERILLHNEQSYTLHWPMKIWFGCLQAARQGGCTPIADSRKILQRLDPGIVAAFERKQIMYVRNYGSGLGLSWREAFQTSDRREVEAHCARESIACVWRGDDGLRTEQRRPAVRAHPKTGEPIWFNHALFFHPSSLDPAALEAIRAVVAEQDMPFNTLYGDGSSIEPSVLDEVRHAYDAETVRFEWRTGDVLMLDNMLACHGRDPFDGPRTVVVAMGEPVTHEPVLVASASASAHS
jgi:alpha-ketoglutarate-dependent taurine dioxygenase